jgi:hypothetical protein
MFPGDAIQAGSAASHHLMRTALTALMVMLNHIEWFQAMKHTPQMLQPPRPLLLPGDAV